MLCAKLMGTAFITFSFTRYSFVVISLFKDIKVCGMLGEACDLILAEFVLLVKAEKLLFYFYGDVH